MKAIVFVTPPDARYGFGISGLRQIVATSDSLPGALRTTAADAVGLLVVDERLIDEHGRAAIGDIEHRWPGVIAVLPAPATAAHGEDDYIRRLIRGAIGYQVRVNL